MDSVMIPSIGELVEMTTKHIDRFCGYSGILNSVYRNESTRTEVASKFLKQMLKRGEDSNLFAVLAEIIMTLASECSDTETSDMKENVEIRKLADTFDKDMIARTDMKIKAMKKMVKDHQAVLCRASETQKAVWKTHDSVTKYNLLVSTATESRKQLENKISQNELRARDKCINTLKTKLELKRQIAENVSMMYFTNITNEDKNRLMLTQISQNLKDEISAVITTQLNNGIQSLKDIVADYVPDRQREILLLKLNNIDVKAFVDRIYKNSSKTYTFPIPMDYLTQHGFMVPLPNGRFEIPQRRELKLEFVNPDKDNSTSGIVFTNYYIKPNAPTTAEKEGFLCIKNGMKIKQKALSNGQKVGYGWTRRAPWSKKEWGFFYSYIPFMF